MPEDPITLAALHQSYKKLNAYARRVKSCTAELTAYLKVMESPMIDCDMDKLKKLCAMTEDSLDALRQAAQETKVPLHLVATNAEEVASEGLVE